MKLKFEVTGMTCAACSARVEKVTAAVPGVDRVEVNLLAGAMTVEAGSDSVTEQIIRDVCDISIRQCLIPVLAHVDRYRGREQFSKYAERLLECDVMFQCNAEAFESFFGRQWALKQLRRGYIHFLGSDCHNLEHRRPKLDIAAAAITQKLGATALEALNTQAYRLVFPE